MMKYSYSREAYESDVAKMAIQVRKRKPKIQLIYGVPQGGVLLAMDLSHRTGIPYGGEWSKEDHRLVIPRGFSKDPLRTLVVDDISDSGVTRKKFSRHPFFSLIVRQESIPLTTWWAQAVGDGFWVDFWWENKDKTGNDIVTRQLEYIGECPSREGLKETPHRVVKSWSDLYSGYGKNPRDIFKVFEEGACDEMVLLKNIEFYSTCEHHLLPFFGKAHIAYIPNGRVVGISKLARLLEIFARRLQIQERLGQQITRTINDFLGPKGAACILEAQHFCMTSRGVQKQNSVMVTSSLTGVFKDKPEARAELLTLIGR